MVALLEAVEPARGRDMQVAEAAIGEFLAARPPATLWFGSSRAS
jgi:hypothetical protein